MEPTRMHGGISDAELTALALSADADAPLDPDAVPLVMFHDGASTLPEWYMPPVSPNAATRWRAFVALGIVLCLVLIEAAGLCSSYGPIVFH